MTLNRIQKLAEKNDVRVSLRKEQGKRVVGLHGFISDIQVVVNQITGHHVEQADTGYYLYSNKSNWE